MHTYVAEPNWDKSLKNFHPYIREYFFIYLKVLTSKQDGNTVSTVNSLHCTSRDSSQQKQTLYPQVLTDMNDIHTQTLLSEWLVNNMSQNKSFFMLYAHSNTCFPQPHCQNIIKVTSSCVHIFLLLFLLPFHHSKFTYSLCLLRKKDEILVSPY